MSEISDSRTPREDGAEDQQSLGHLFRGWMRTVLGGRDDATLRATIEDLIEDQDSGEGSLGAGERALLANILKLRDRTVDDVMVPRADIVAVDVDTPFPALVQRMAEEAHSRLPVFRETLDDVVGMVHIKDVLVAMASRTPVELKDIVRDLSIVAPSMPVVDLLVQMRQKRQHMALVVDEFGGIDGLVTIEDLVEEIVGEIEDEHDVEEESFIKSLPNGDFVVKALTPIETLNETLETRFADAEADTAGGLVMNRLGHLPKRNEETVIDDFRFRVLNADGRRIHLLRVTPVNR